MSQKDTSATPRKPHPIRVARQRRHLSQAALGEIVGASKAAVSKWEQGGTFPEPGTAFRLSRALQIPLEQVYADARGGV